MLVDKIQDDLRQAQLDRDEVKVSTLRLLLSEIHNGEILLRQSSGQEKGGPLSDENIISVIQREIKKRKEAAAGFRSGDREDQAQREEVELKILEGLTKIVEDSINEVGAKSHD